MAIALFLAALRRIRVRVAIGAAVGAELEERGQSDGLVRNATGALDRAEGQAMVFEVEVGGHHARFADPCCAGIVPGDTSVGEKRVVADGEYLLRATVRDGSNRELVAAELQPGSLRTKASLPTPFVLFRFSMGSSRRRTPNGRHISWGPAPSSEEPSAEHGPIWTISLWADRRCVYQIVGPEESAAKALAETVIPFDQPETESPRQ